MLDLGRRLEAERVGDCPKCHAARRVGDDLIFLCGSIDEYTPAGFAFKQSDKCRIAELEEKVAGLRPFVAQSEIYGEELDDICEVLLPLHPIGEIKAIGRREAALALREVADAITSQLDAAVAERDALAALAESKEWETRLPNTLLVTRSEHPFREDSPWCVMHGDQLIGSFPTALSAVRFSIERTASKREEVEKLRTMSVHT